MQYAEILAYADRGVTERSPIETVDRAGLLWCRVNCLCGSVLSVPELICFGPYAVITGPMHASL
ncbi:hypothetical protein ADK43_26770 [Streptomyces rimosus subsp. rimosus]|nr:hypothetical protein ADK43_26770 [Streptomyces rimosus subsp. rimosus]